MPRKQALPLQVSSGVRCAVSAAILHPHTTVLYTHTMPAILGIAAAYAP